MSQYSKCHAYEWEQSGNQRITLLLLLLLLLLFITCIHVRPIAIHSSLAKSEPPQFSSSSSKPHSRLHKPNVIRILLAPAYSMNPLSPGLQCNRYLESLTAFYYKNNNKNRKHRQFSSSSISVFVFFFFVLPSSLVSSAFHTSLGGFLFYFSSRFGKKKDSFNSNLLVVVVTTVRKHVT
jgi:hypothetical protein